MKLRRFALVLSLAAIGAASGKDCSDEANSLAVAECRAARYVAADKALNAVYGQAMKSPPGEREAIAHDCADRLA